MTNNNIGIDLMLDANGDFIFNEYGDFYTTEDAEALLTDLPYAGYVCLNETIYRIIQAIKFSWPLDPQFGSNLRKKLSKPITPDLIRDMENDLREALEEDDRIDEVYEIEIEQYPKENKIIINVKVIPIGESEVSEHVFPYTG